MGKTKISIIMPIYNAEKYLKDAVDSVLKQTLKEIELIAIDDCSSDNSLSILKEYAKKDNRLKILKTNTNSGKPGIPRNLGLQKATGDYIAFLDSDDYIDKTMYEKLYKKAKETNADIIKCNTLLFGGNIKKPYAIKKYLDRKTPKTVFSIQTFPDYILSFNFWTGLYKNKFKKNKFPEIKIGEDICWYVTTLLQAKSICHLKEPLHFYRQLEDSISNKNTQKEKDELCQALMAIVQKQKDHRIQALLSSIVIKHCDNKFDIIKSVYENLPEFEDILKNNFKKIYKKNKKNIQK